MDKETLAAIDRLLAHVAQTVREAKAANAEPNPLRVRAKVTEIRRQLTAIDAELAKQPTLF